MDTVRRRDLRPRPLTQSAVRVLAAAASAGPLTTDELVAQSGVRAQWAWPAVAQLLERGLLELVGERRVQVTRSGRSRARRAA